MLALSICGYVLIAFGVVGTLLPFLQYDDYWIRMWDYPRTQLAVIMGIGVLLVAASDAVAGLTKWDTIIIAIAGVGISWQVYRILPYTPIWNKQVVSASAEPHKANESELQLMVSNVLQSNDRYDELAKLVEEVQPDLLLTLESNHTWERELAQRFGDDYSERIQIPLENRYGMHLWSRLPLRRTEVMHLISDSIPSLHTQVQLTGGQWIEFYGLHPTPPSPTEESTSTARDAELALLGKRITERGNEHTLVAGDLNDVAWSHSTRLFQRLSGLLDPRQGRGLFATFHADHWWARWPLDHVFHSQEFQVVNLERLRYIGSDHFPVTLTLRHVPGETHKVEEPEPEGNDKVEADKTIATAKKGEVDGLLIEE